MISDKSGTKKDNKYAAPIPKDVKLVIKLKSFFVRYRDKSITNKNENIFIEFE